ncbi:glycosyltransferase family 2 protein [Paraburkholderia sp. MM5384-R2]|uniref:glycosyltransferase family 2 protein n=1 Tax=Paraburkholderia sp. MM5384-R2 TaxID=2723097 RepID=UPI00161EF1AB|nr:glycosyltransferase family 2 protein [Paraburkholderia sp. MM5384-R2]MBB5501851.1 glycosyltransferase involved in cell wall biosynthesis [Paraburkholderia sp. MM5384-R2]
MTTMNLVVPCYNEEEVLSETSKRLLALLERLIEAGDFSKESRITFIDDGSRDHTWSIIEALHAKNARCGGIKLSRNRGHQNALLAGPMTAQGDVLVSLDADLQDDIEAVPRMLGGISIGCGNCFWGASQAYDGHILQARHRAQLRNYYYRLLRTFGVDILPGHADFRLMSRKTVEALRQFQEVNRFLRGIIPLLGLKTAIVEYERSALCG